MNKKLIWKIYRLRTFVCNMWFLVFTSVWWWRHCWRRTIWSWRTKFWTLKWCLVKRKKDSKSCFWNSGNNVSEIENLKFHTDVKCTQHECLRNLKLTLLKSLVEGSNFSQYSSSYFRHNYLVIGTKTVKES